MNIISKVFKFLLICAGIAGVIVALGAIYTAYTADQAAKVQHYNKALEAWSGVKATCQSVIPDNRK